MRPCPSTSASAWPPPSTACTPSLATSRRYRALYRAWAARPSPRARARARSCIAPTPTPARALRLTPACATACGLAATDALRVQVGPPTGIETLEADTFRLECYQTPTGIKFLMLAEPKATALDTILKQVYSL